MPTCPTCHRQFPVGQKRCPDDDALLEATAAEIAVAGEGTMAVPALAATVPPPPGTLPLGQAGAAGKGAGAGAAACAATVAVDSATGATPDLASRTGPAKPATLPIEEAEGRGAAPSGIEPTMLPGQQVILGAGGTGPGAVTVEPPMVTPPPVAVAMPALKLVLERDSGDLKPGTSVGEYVVRSKLGEGGMGTVYAGVQPIIGKKVAIKVLSRQVAHDPDVVKRFIAEARAVNQIGHRNIIDIFSFGQLADGREYFVMEYLPGRSLEDEIAKRRALPLREAFELMGQVCDALHAAHESGIIHRDLKPDNIYICEQRDGPRLVKLLDFGIAKLAGDDLGMSKTRTGVAMGTPAYMSPEQCRGNPVDRRTDLYAAGVILFRLATGRLPFSGDSVLEVLGQHVSATPPKPSAMRPMPPELEAAILKCMAKAPAERFASARELGDTLAAISKTMAPEEAEAAPTIPEVDVDLPRPAEPAPPPPRLSRALVAGLAVLFLVVAVGLGVTFGSGGRGPAVAALPADAGVAPKPPASAPAPPPASAPARGELVVKTNLDDAAVTLDGKPVGKGRSVTVKDLAAGSYIVEVSREKHQSQSRTIKVEGGKTVDEAFVLVKAPRGGPGPGTKAPSDPSKTPPPPKPPKPLKDKDGTIDVFGK
jgi:serine/threonine-protein kinase